MVGQDTVDLATNQSWFHRDQASIPLNGRQAAFLQAYVCVRTHTCVRVRRRKYICAHVYVAGHTCMQYCVYVCLQTGASENCTGRMSEHAARDKESTADSEEDLASTSGWTTDRCNAA